MANSQFLAFAIGVGANVLDYTTYQGSAFRTNGFAAGVASSEQLNTVWRQSSFIAAAVAKAVADLTTTDVEDDGDLDAMVLLIKEAITAAGGVTAFNTRTGAITLTLADVNAAQTGKLVLHSDPTSALHAATKQYVDAYASGFQPKTAAALATTANITLSGEQTIDGTMTSASRVLVKDQTAPAENGLYTSGAGAWTRATDMDAWSEVPGASAFVTGGSVNAGREYYCTSAAGGTLNTTAITWILRNAPQTYTSSGGITLTGTNFTLTNMAAATVKGRAAGAGTGAPTDLDGDDLAAIVSPFVGDTGTGGEQGLVPAPPAGSAADDLYLNADGTFKSPKRDFVSFQGKGSNGACSINAERGFSGGVTRTASGTYLCTFDGDLGDTAYGVVVTTSQQNCVASYTKATDSVIITIQQGNANVGSSPQNPSDVTVQILR